MSKIRVVQKHELGVEEAKAKSVTLMERMKDKMSAIIKEISWNEDGTRGTASGKMFEAQFEVGEDQVSMDVELKGLGAGFLAPKVKSDLERTLKRTFG